MSRIPPASVRLTSDFLNYNQVGASEYYFNVQLKETILHENIVNLLGSNVGFVTMKQKRKHLPRLIMGVLPIFTALRAKKCFDRFLTKSYDWLRTKLFRGAQSSALRYHNAFLFPRAFALAKAHTRHAKIAVSALPKMCRKNSSKDARLPSITSQFLQNLACYRWKPNKKSYINHSDWYRRFNTQSISQKRLVPTNRPPKMGKPFKTRQSLSTFQQNKQDEQRSILPNTIAIYDAKLKALLSPRKKTKQIMSALCKYDNKMRGPYRKKSLHRYQKRSYGPSRSVFFKRGWSKNSLFALYCLEQIFGKINPHSTLALAEETGPVAFTEAKTKAVAGVGTMLSPQESILLPQEPLLLTEGPLGLCSSLKSGAFARRSARVVGYQPQKLVGPYHKSSLHAQGLHCKPTTVKGNATRLKKRYKKRFYDIQCIGMLSSDSRLEVRNGRHIPRSQIDKLRPRTLYELLPGTYKEKFAKIQSLISTNIWPSKHSVDFKSKFLKNLRLRAKRENYYVHLLDFDRYIGQFKTNVTPKFWVSRRFNVNMILNMFCFVQGKITGKQKRHSTFQGGCSATAGFGCGVPRLKSGFLFEFDVHSNSSKEIKTLRPTITLRF